MSHFSSLFDMMAQCLPFVSRGLPCFILHNFGEETAHCVSQIRIRSLHKVLRMWPLKLPKIMKPMTSTTTVRANGNRNEFCLEHRVQRSSARQNFILDVRVWKGAGFALQSKRLFSSVHPS